MPIRRPPMNPRVQMAEYLRRRKVLALAAARLQQLMDANDRAVGPPAGKPMLPVDDEPLLAPSGPRNPIAGPPRPMPEWPGGIMGDPEVPVGPGGGLPPGQRPGWGHPPVPMGDPEGWEYELLDLIRGRRPVSRPFDPYL